MANKDHEMTLCEQYFVANVPSDDEFRQDIDQIGEMAERELRKFHIKLGFSYVPIAFYCVVWDTILEYFKELQKTKESFGINIANRLEMGFTTSFDGEDSDLEKLGNFMIYMKNIDHASIFDVPDSDKTVEICNEWAVKNIDTIVKEVEEITKRASQNISKKLGFHVTDPTVILAMFCTIHDKILDYLKLKREEADVFEVSIIFCGRFEAYARLLDEGLEISFKPCVFAKGFIKEDGAATAKYE